VVAQRCEFRLQSASERGIKKNNNKKRLQYGLKPGETRWTRRRWGISSRPTRGHFEVFRRPSRIRADLEERSEVQIWKQLFQVQAFVEAIPACSSKHRSRTYWTKFSATLERERQNRERTGACGLRNCKEKRTSGTRSDSTKAFLFTRCSASSRPRGLDESR